MPTFATFLGVGAACNIDLPFSDAEALIIAANNALSHTLSGRSKGLISYTTNGFETPHLIIFRNNLFMNPGE